MYNPNFGGNLAKAGGGVALLAGPVGWAIAGGAVLIFAAIEIDKHCKKEKEKKKEKDKKNKKY